jgi:hypothetical protein
MGKNAARITKQFTEPQIQAIMRSVALEGNTPAQTQRMAELGDLGVPAFTIDKRYIYQLIKRNRDQFESQNPEAMALATHQALAEIHRLNLSDARRVNRTTDPAERSRIAKAVADSAKALGQAPKIDAPKPNAPVNKGETETAQPVNTPDVLHGLLNTTVRGAKSGSVSRASNGSTSSPAT